MFMKALDQMGKLDDLFFGNIPPDETVKLAFNLSQGEDERGPLPTRAERPPMLQAI
jgi:Mn-containing catalase